MWRSYTKSFLLKLCKTFYFLPVESGASLDAQRLGHTQINPGGGGGGGGTHVIW